MDDVVAALLSKPQVQRGTDVSTFTLRAKALLENPAMATLARVEEQAKALVVLRRKEQYLAVMSAALKVADEAKTALAAQDDERAAKMILQLASLKVKEYTHLAAFVSGVVRTIAEKVHERQKKRALAALDALDYPKSAVHPRKPSASLDALLSSLALLYGISVAADAPQDAHKRAVDVLLEPIAVRLEFHFGAAAGRPTARVDRPEWLCASVTQTLVTHVPLFVDAVLDVPRNPSASDAFVAGLARLSAGIFASRRTALLADPAALCSSVAEAVSLDSRILELIPDIFDHVDNNDLENLAESSDLADKSVQSYSESKPSVSAALLLNPNGTLSPLCDSWCAAESAAAMAAFEEVCATQPASAAIAVLQPLIDRFVASPGMPSHSVRCAIVAKAVLPVLDALAERLAFALPAFHASAEDVRTAVTVANNASEAADAAAGWGELPAVLELAALPEAQAAFGAGVCGQEGTVFGVQLAALRASVLQRALQLLEAHAWDSWASPLQSYSRAMHYAVRREGEPGMHDDLRRGNASLADALSRRLAALQPALLTRVAAAVLGRCDAFFVERVVLQNYFVRPRGCARFAGDACATADAVEALASRLSISDVAMEGTREAATLVDAPREQQTALAAALAEDDVGAAAERLKALGVRRLTLAQCDRVLSLVRDEV